LTFEQTGVYNAPVPEFRYAQFCPLTRAVEILGERWTVLLLRELFLGPRRFSDLKVALNGVSTSVLTERLARLEERGIVCRRDLPPPAASTVYQLDEAGRALKPVLVELTRWGLRFLDAPSSGDCIRPDWLVLGLEVFARREPGPSVGVRLVVEAGAESVVLHVRGGTDGTTVSRAPLPFDASVAATPLDMVLFTSGALTREAATTSERLKIHGDPDTAWQVPGLFDFHVPPAPHEASQAQPETNQGVLAS
jgi:DNA-binding HxlR family transcriptional regulator